MSSHMYLFWNAYYRTHEYIQEAVFFPWFGCYISHKVKSQRHTTTVWSLDTVKHKTVLSPVRGSLLESEWSRRKVVWRPAAFCPKKEMICCLLYKHPECIPADETLTSQTTRTFCLRRGRAVCASMCVCMCVWSFTLSNGHDLLSLSVSLSIWLLVVFKMGHLTAVTVMAGK